MSSWTGSRDTSRSGNRGRQAPPTGSGFTLLEVLVAFAVLAVALGIAFEVFSTGLRGSRVAQSYTTATLVAESLLDGVGIDTELSEGETGGVFANGYRWRVDIRPHQRGQEGFDDPNLPLALEVRVTVTWNEARKTRSLQLVSLRLASR